MVRKILSRFSEVRRKQPQFEDARRQSVCAEATSPPSAVTQAEGGQSLEFDEDWYLQQNPDVALAIREGRGKSGLEHYLAHGRKEGRQPLRPRSSPAGERN